MERVLPVLVAILLVRLVASEAQYQRARRSGNTFYFPPGIGLRLVMGLGGPFMLYVAYRLALDARVTGESWLAIMAGTLAFGTVLFKPSEISVDKQGVKESGFLGLRRKMIQDTSCATNRQARGWMRGLTKRSVSIGFEDGALLVVPIQPDGPSPESLEFGLEGNDAIWIA